MLSTSFNCLHPLVVLHIPPESYLGELGAQRMGLTSGEDLGGCQGYGANTMQH